MTDTVIVQIVADIALGGLALAAVNKLKGMHVELKKLVDSVVKKQDNHEVRLLELERK